MEQKAKIIKEFISKNLKWIILFLCVICFLGIVEEVFNEEIVKWDEIGYKFLSTYVISDFITPIAKFITNIGGPIGLVITVIVSFAVLKDKRISIAVASNLVISAALNFLLKNILQRPRPVGNRIINETGYSLPSGHSMVSIAFYGFVIYLIYKKVKNRYIKWTLITFLSILIILVGISRIYLGVHYTTDVASGFLVGISYLIIYISALNKFIFEKELEKDVERGIMDNYGIKGSKEDKK